MRNRFGTVGWQASWNAVALRTTLCAMRHNTVAFRSAQGPTARARQAIRAVRPTYPAGAPATTIRENRHQRPRSSFEPTDSKASNERPSATNRANTARWLSRKRKRRPATHQSHSTHKKKNILYSCFSLNFNNINFTINNTGTECFVECTSATATIPHTEKK